MPRRTPSTDILSIPVLLLHALDTYRAAIRSALEEAGYDDLPKNGAFVIGGLALQKSGRPLRQLINELGLSKQTAGQLTDALVVRGYLKREVDEADRRQLTIALTERGRAAARVLGVARERVDAELTVRAGTLSVERLRRVLATVAEVGREFQAQNDG